jgi:RimJ/RimL family protein N-acetyltransferase
MMLHMSNSQMMGNYPSHYEFDVVLRDGSTLRLRPVRPDDGEALGQLYARLSEESRYLRYFAFSPRAREVARVLRADHDNEFVLVAESGGRLSGAASYSRDPKSPDRAEVAFTIADALQGRGIGTRMLETLAGIAREHRIRIFDAYVLQSNDRMMRVFLDSGFEVERRLEDGVFHVVLALEDSGAFEAKAAERSRAAATASMKHFFEPATVAVVGANRERGKIGSEILHNLVAGGFRGRLFAIHPSASSIGGDQHRIGPAGDLGR